MTGNGSCWGAKALTARCSRTAESLPPEKSRTGRSHSATTSRRMKMAWDSSRSRWSVVVEGRKGVVVIVRKVSVYPSKTLENVRPFTNAPDYADRRPPRRTRIGEREFRTFDPDQDSR